MFTKTCKILHNCFKNVTLNFIWEDAAIKTKLPLAKKQYEEQ